jgi:hypothetical protein
MQTSPTRWAATVRVADVCMAMKAKTKAWITEELWFLFRRGEDVSARLHCLDRNCDLHGTCIINVVDCTLSLHKKILFYHIRHIWNVTTNVTRNCSSVELQISRYCASLICIVNIWFRLYSSRKRDINAPNEKNRLTLLFTSNITLINNGTNKTITDIKQA